MLIPALSPTYDASTTADTSLSLLPDALRRQAAEKIEKLNEKVKTMDLSQIPLVTRTAKKELSKAPREFLDTILAYLTSVLPSYPAMNAAVIGSYHLGIPHKHPFRPWPLPSFGALKYGGCASVLINGFPAARVGNVGVAYTCMSVAPFFQVVTGSSSVFIGGSRAARLGDMTRACGSAAFSAVALAKKGLDIAIDVVTTPEQATAIKAQQAQIDSVAATMKALVGLDPCVPPCIGAMLPISSTVEIGGYPLPESGEILKRVITLGTGLYKRLQPVVRDAFRADKLRSLFSGINRLGRTSNFLDKTLRIFTGHPVDVVSGSFVLDAVDVELPGALPLRLARSYSSTWGSRPSPFGHGWSHSLGESIWREADQLVYRAHDGRELELPLVDRETFVPLHRLTLRPLDNNGWQIESADGLLRDFPPLTHTPSQLLKIHDRRGHRIDLEYDDTRLVRAHTPDGREIRLHYTDTGHIAQIDLPDPDPTSEHFIPHIHYAYAGDDLIQITDALGHVTRYRHDNHKITEETLPNGLRFHFAYDGRDTDAACTRTHGDGGIIDHSLIYDRPRRTTLVTNSHKEPTVIRHGAHGEPLSITDARGAVTRHEYDEHLRRTATIDPLGHATRHEYDARGNCTRTIAADGATTTAEYARDLLVAATDPAGGRWRWSYDAQSRLTRRTDPLGRTTTFTYSNLTTTITHPDGRRELHTHDLAGRLVRVDLPDGRTLHHTHDRRGRLIHTVHPDGTRESHAHDLINRPVRHTLPTGDTRHFTHDDLGNLVRTCDARTDLRCTYTGLRWLASVGDVNAAPTMLERDLEGRVLRVADATGTVLHLERDATGLPRICTDHRGRRRFTRDLAGRITAISLDGQTTAISRDPAGRITAIDHGHTRDEFTHRPDGALLTATRRDAHGTTTIRRELDIHARILREWQDDRWVALTHDLRDRLTHLRSSSGADIRFHHDDHGLARITLPGSTWTLTREHDRHGRELTRQLPGGITGWWHRDPAGRPLEHGVTGSRPPQIHRHRRYTWTVDGRLASELDLTVRPRPRNTPPSPTCPKDHTDHNPHTPRHDALGRCITRDTTQWQWCGDLLVHTHTSTTHTWIFDRTTSSTPPLARLSTHGNLSLLTDPTNILSTFDDHGAPVSPPQDLPPAPVHLDIFARPDEPTPALALLTAELARDLPALTPTPPIPSRESAVLAAIFRSPPAP